MQRELLENFGVPDFKTLKEPVVTILKNCPISIVGCWPAYGLPLT